MKELLERRKEVSTLAGIKFTDGNLIVGSACVTEALKESAVFLGSDTLLLPALIQGFDSAIGTTINVFPDLNNLIYR